jgi:hypothetical protein
MLRKLNILLMVSIIVLALMSSLSAQTKKSALPQNEKPKVETVGIEEVIKAVGEALKEAQDNNVPGFPPLKSVEITLSVVESKEGGAKFKILVFSIGGGISGEYASTITLKMQPPTTKQGSPASAVDKKKYKMALASALNVSKAGVISAKEALPQLITSNVEIEVAFTVKGDAEGGISIEPIGLADISAGLGLSGKLSKSQVHKMKLVFGTGSS